MEKTQLVAIAVTALISVTAKEFIAWLVSFVKSQVKKETTKAKVRKIFNRKTLFVIVDIAGISIPLFFLISDIRKTSPISRIDIFLISYWTLLAAYYVSNFFVHSAQAIENYRSHE